MEDSIKKLKRSKQENITSITLGELKSIIRFQPNRKAPGPDGIPNTALKKLFNKTILYITKIFNYTLQFNYIPKTYKTPVIIMIPKPGKNHNTPTNHRPISLLNTTAILTRLKTVTEKIIRPEQFAFRKDHSTKLIDHLSNSINRSERTVAAFLDFEKAFDKI